MYRNTDPTQIPVYIRIATAYGAEVALEMAVIHRIKSYLHFQGVCDGYLVCMQKLDALTIVA